MDINLPPVFLFVWDHVRQVRTFYQKICPAIKFFLDLSDIQR